MFLCEAALGKQRMIRGGEVGWNEKDPVSAGGHDSCYAIGQTEPDPADDLEIELDGESVIVPQGKVKPNKEVGNGHTSYSQSEYLVYDESQVRIRYVLQMEFQTPGGHWH